MKRFLLGLLATAGVLTLPGCISVERDDDPDQITSTTTITPTSRTTTVTQD